MHRKDYIVVKDRHPRISEVLNDCVNLCVPTSKNEPLSSILQKICGKLTEAISDIAAVEAEVDELQDVEPPEGLHFGVSGEDDTAGENRFFTIDSYKLEVGKADSSVLFGVYGESGANTVGLTVSNANFPLAGKGIIDVSSSPIDGSTVIQISVEGTTSSDDSVQIIMQPNLLNFTFGNTAVFNLNNILQDDTSTKLLALDASNYVKWVDKSTIAPSLQAVTDVGNTTDNQIFSSVANAHAYAVTTVDGGTGIAFTIESGGWYGTYLGAAEFPASGSDQGNIYIGLAAGQGRTDGGTFNTYFGYQAGIGALGDQYKFYLAQGTSNHLMYGDFFNGGLSIKGGVYSGPASGDWTTMPLPVARFEAAASNGTAGTAPIKLNAGTNLVTPVNGTIEFDGINLYITIAGLRKTIALVP